MASQKQTMKVYRVRVNYKSSRSEVFECVTFKTTTQSGTLTGIEWESYGDVKPMLIGINDIESIWQIGEREVEDD